VKAYWNNLNERERLMLGICGVLCIIYLFYLLIYSPLTKAIQDKTKQLSEKQATLVWMADVSKEYKATKPLQTLTKSQLLSMLAAELNVASFKNFPYQIQQTGQNDIQLLFEKVPYNGFMVWLWSLNQKYRIVVKQFNIERTDTTGIVKLTLILTNQ
jgi:general secretion pathway protein M